MQAYISVSLSKRNGVNQELATISTVLKNFDITPFIFVDQYRFTPDQERAMMQQATLDIDHCDLLIAEVSDKGIGIGIEVGYAKAKGKPVIYVRHVDAEHSTTASGISDFQILYKDNIDLQQQLAGTIKNIFHLP